MSGPSRLHFPIVECNRRRGISTSSSPPLLGESEFYFFRGGSLGVGGELRRFGYFGAFFRDASRGQCQAGSLSGAEHLSKDNAGVPRPAQRGQKPRVEQKGKCWLDPDFQYEYGP